MTTGQVTAWTHVLGKRRIFVLIRSTETTNAEILLQWRT
jgi:hypothetical protein